MDGKEIIAMIRDNLSANFQSYIRDAVPELEFHTLSTLRTFKRALLTAAIRKECGGDVHQYLKRKKQGEEELDTFIASVQAITDTLGTEDCESQSFRQIIFGMFAPEIKETMLQRNITWIDALPSPSAIYRAA